MIRSCAPEARLRHYFYVDGVTVSRAMEMVWKIPEGDRTIQHGVIEENTWYSLPGMHR